MSSKILDEILNRKITRLCHFTKLSKLLHIITNENGIQSNYFFDDLKETLIKNDENRYDNKEDYVCCSIQYSNTWYLNRIKDNDPLFKDWIALLINPILLADDNTLFCHRNAASNYGRNIKPGYEGFIGMFAESVQGKSTIRRSKMMLPACPTDGQAEVLIYKNIPREYIQGILVENEELARKVRIILKILKRSPLPIIVSSEFFSNTWNSKIRNGKIPVEKLHREE